MQISIAQTAGVDISKESLDIHLHPEGASARFGNDKKGFTALIKWLAGRTIARIVFEPTGAYHRAFETRFLEAGFTLAKVNPRQARRFAEAVGTNAKTDAVDAAMLARFGAMLEPRALAPASAILNDMKDLLVARRALVKDRTAAQNRAQQQSLALLKAQATERLKQIDRQIAAIDDALRARLGDDPALKVRFDILVSIPGLGEVTALALLIDMPELGTLENKCAASLAGLAPMARDSGQWRGKRFIRGGRAELRHALYMPALVAMRFNADLKAVYDRLTEAGKPAKVAIVAVMRKMLILANALLRKGAAWTPKLA
jgi:transposase